MAEKTPIAAALVLGAALGAGGAGLAGAAQAPEVVSAEDSDAPCQTEVRLALRDEAGAVVAEWGEVYPGCGETAPTERGAPGDLRFCVGARPASQARDGEPTLCAE